MSVFSRWSNSSLTTLQMCAHKFKLKHLDKMYRQSGYQAKRGIAVHHVAKEAHKRQMVELNVDALHDLTVRALPGMLGRGSGAILNVASTAAFQSKV